MKKKKKSVRKTKVKVSPEKTKSKIKVPSPPKTKAPVKEPKESQQEPHSIYVHPEKDPAHKPGHRKMNLKDKLEKHTGPKNQPQDESALNNMARNDIIYQTSGTNRRIISGAAIGKTGRIGARKK